MATPKTESERYFQQRFVNELKKYKWADPELLNGNKRKVTVQDLVQNWRHELNRLNVDQLEGQPLTDEEFKQVIARVRQLNNSYDAARLLAMEESTGKIDGIIRDPNPKITRDKITLTIFKKTQVSGGNSSYQIAQEVQTERGNRFDLILLINGLPLINIELKRADIDMRQGFGQFKRYYAAGEFNNNFMAFSQMMVISTELDTRYFATPKSLNEFNEKFVFRWATSDNTPVTAWQDVIKHFLMIPMAHQMVGDYLIIDEAWDVDQRRHMVMRPYQVHALQAVERAARGAGPDGFRHGGFVWHTTGSGKTITSFKTALVLSTRLNYDKVIFLVDRRELDARTSENFKAYAEYEAVQVDDTNYTYDLKKKLISRQSGIIVTTTFKLDNLVKELEENQRQDLRERRYVFIIDEAHRTTMGQMMGRIKHYFRKHSVFYGFTGTPLFEENQVQGKINEKSELIDTTEKLFGPLLHQYTIDEAIADGNVLGFNVDYINTGEFESYRDLRHEILERWITDNKGSKLKLERQVAALSEAELEREAMKLGILQYHDDTHMPRVVSRILDNWDSQSQDKHFNALLTVAYKERVLAYYKEFKKQIAERNKNDQVPCDLNVALTVSFGNENDPDNIMQPHVIQQIFDDYEAFTGVHFSADGGSRSTDAFFQDLIHRTTRGGSGRNPRNIDLVIVADQLLTGYDSKLLNTLYVDRSLELQGLIQAYSRTNRVYNASKEFGTIINFLTPALTKESVDKALTLYGSGGTSSKAIVEPYEVAADTFQTNVLNMREELPDPKDWRTLERDKEAREDFLKVFRVAAQSLNVVQQYYAFTWEGIASIIDRHTWLLYRGAYKNLQSEGNSDDDLPIPTLKGKVELVDSDIVDQEYIIKLIGKELKPQVDQQSIQDDTLQNIYDKIEELSNLGEDTQARMLREFVDTELLPGNVPDDMSFEDAYRLWRLRIKDEEVQKFAKEWAIDPKILRASLDRFDLSKPGEVPYIDEIVSSQNEERMKESPRTALELSIYLTKNLPLWIKETTEKYGTKELENL